MIELAMVSANFNRTGVISVDLPIDSLVVDISPVSISYVFDTTQPDLETRTFEVLTVGTALSRSALDSYRFVGPINGGPLRFVFEMVYD